MNQSHTFQVGYFPLQTLGRKRDLSLPLFEVSMEIALCSESNDLWKCGNLYGISLNRTGNCKHKTQVNSARFTQEDGSIVYDSMLFTLRGGKLIFPSFPFRNVFWRHWHACSSLEFWSSSTDSVEGVFLLFDKAVIFWKHFELISCITCNNRSFGYPIIYTNTIHNAVPFIDTLTMFDITKLIL